MGISNLAAAYQVIWFLMSCLWIPEQLFTVLRVPEAFFPSSCKYQNPYSMIGESLICVTVFQIRTLCVFLHEWGKENEKWRCRRSVCKPERKVWRCWVRSEKQFCPLCSPQWGREILHGTGVPFASEGLIFFFFLSLLLPPCSEPLMQRCIASCWGAGICHNIHHLWCAHLQPALLISLRVSSTEDAG